MFRFSIRLLIMCVSIFGLKVQCQWSDCTRTVIPQPSGASVTAGNVSELVTAVNQANGSGGNVTIWLEDGSYFLSSMLYVTADHVVVRSLSGDRDAVEVYGLGMAGGVSHVFLVRGSYFTCADITLGRVANHGIQIQGEQDADFPTIHNVRFVDTGEQMLKVSYGGGVTGSNNGIVEWCLFEYTAGIGPQYYIGGVDAHHAIDWTVRFNQFRYIRSPEIDLAEHAIHFWSFSEQTHVYQNQITDCDRGIGFGLGTSGHIGGLIINNMVHTTRDVGIGLETASDVNVYHNTVFTENYGNSIEYRFSGTEGGAIMNNLTNMAISSRNGGSATLGDNVSHAETTWFNNPSSGDLHLSDAITEIVDMGSFLPEVSIDFDCQDRPMGGGVDIGADEYHVLSLPEVFSSWLNVNIALCGTQAPNITYLIAYLNNEGCGT